MLLSVTACWCIGCLHDVRLFGVVIYILSADELSGDPDRYILYLLQLLSASVVQQPEYVIELSSSYRQSLRVRNPPPSPLLSPPKTLSFLPLPPFSQCSLIHLSTPPSYVFAVLTHNDTIMIMISAAAPPKESMPTFACLVPLCLSSISQALHSLCTCTWAWL